MDYLVRTYLLQKSRVSIPGLGTIYVDRTPARSDFINKQLLPPSYHFRFDKYFDAPGKDFFTFLAANKHVEDFEAIRMYNDWAQSLRSNIGNDESASLEGIGLLKRDVSGDVLFEPVAAPTSYNVPVPAKRIIRTHVKHTMLVGDKEVNKEVGPSDVTGYLFEDAHRKKLSWWVYAAVIAVVAIAAIVFHFSRQGNISAFGNQQTIEPR
ncbi:MAG: hypothetical protein EOO00_06215 [Chitinophagaceae bacterium]|nr:MAG: hypothetical protein EOO00_06215 [Chitinophagaceae bacterium]